MTFTKLSRTHSLLTLRFFLSLSLLGFVSSSQAQPQPPVPAPAKLTRLENLGSQIFKDKSLVNIEKNVASVNEVFRLQNEKELSNAEKMYLPKV
jgi:hypothetical protein